MEPVLSCVTDLVAGGTRPDLIAGYLGTLISKLLVGNVSLGNQRVREQRIANSQSLPQSPPYLFRRAGDYWDINYDSGGISHLRDLTGLSDIARLLKTPFVPVTALELMGASGGGLTRSATYDDGIYLDDGRGVPLADPATVRDLSNAQHELQEQILAATGRGDIEGVQRLRDLEEQYKCYLGSVTDKRGCPRASAGAAGKARLAVRNRITKALQAVAAVSPDLAVHLDRSIKTGSTVVYQPENPLHWQF